MKRSRERLSLFSEFVRDLNSESRLTWLTGSGQPLQGLPMSHILPSRLLELRSRGGLGRLVAPQDCWGTERAEGEFRAGSEERGLADREWPACVHLKYDLPAQIGHFKSYSEV